MMQLDEMQQVKKVLCQALAIKTLLSDVEVLSLCYLVSLSQDCQDHRIQLSSHRLPRSSARVLLFSLLSLFNHLILTLSSFLFSQSNTSIIIITVVEAICNITDTKSHFLLFSTLPMIHFQDDKYLEQPGAAVSSRSENINLETSDHQQRVSELIFLSNHIQTVFTKSQNVLGPGSSSAHSLMLVRATLVHTTLRMRTRLI